MTACLTSAVSDDWPAMDGGQSSPVTTRALDALYAAALAYRPPDSQGEAVMGEILHQPDTMTEARRGRLVKAAGLVPGVIWLLLFGGAALTIGFTFFFGTVNLRAQALMTGALKMPIFSGLLVIVTIDHPFTGVVKVEPEALLEVIHDLGHASAPAATPAR